MVQVRKVTTEQERQQAFRVREAVFVQEQRVAPEEEYDRYDETATHFVAYDTQQQACGTARWRETPQGVKLERFAVLKPHRKRGVGAALLSTVLQDIEHTLGKQSPHIYLHAQTAALPFYEKFGFQKAGEEFEECGIRHFRMIRP